jgi:hypothetical protein
VRRYNGNQFNVFQSPIFEFNFYRGTSWNGQPLVTFLAGVASCLLLGFVIREEDVETLMTAQPIDVLLYQKVSEREGASRLFAASSQQYVRTPSSPPLTPPTHTRARHTS